MPLPSLGPLFDPRVVTELVDLASGPVSALLPEEAAAMTRAHESRLLEFRGGRHCARLALARFGAPGVAVGRAEDRSPVWPEGFVGSISHTRSTERGVCGAAVARTADVRSVGLDLELDESLARSLWKRVLRSAEQEAIERRPEEEWGYLGKLVFSAKECVYKCQYPLTRTFLEFSDVEIELGTSGVLAATLCRDAGPLAEGTTFAVHFLREGGLVATGTTLL